MRRFILVGGAALALAACNPGQDASPAAGGAGAPAAAEAAPAAQMAQPKLDDGLWVVTTTTDHGGMELRICYDQAVQDRLSAFGQQGPGMDCQTSGAPGGPGVWAFRSTCTTPQGHVATEGRASGDFRVNYRVEATSTTTGAPIAEMNGTRSVTVAGRREGDCPAGWRPGDAEVMGQRVNIADAAAR